MKSACSPGLNCFSCSSRWEWPLASSNQTTGPEKARVWGYYFFKQESLISTACKLLQLSLWDSHGRDLKKKSKENWVLTQISPKWVFKSNQIKPLGAWDSFAPTQIWPLVLRREENAWKTSSTSNSNLRAFSGDLNVNESETSGLDFTQMLHNLNN